MKRPLCRACNRNPAAINCHKGDRVYYRSRCDACIRKGRKQKAAVPRWQASGYKKKMVCDRCGFRARSSAQTMVYHVNGDLNDSELRNLKTICLNCSVEVIREDLPWRRGDLEEDR
jgi:hypothetical protein